MSEIIYPWGDSRPYNSYSRYFKELFGRRMQKLSIDAGFSCPNRDGSLSVGGCTFCNNKAFNPSYCRRSDSITTQIEEGIAFAAHRYKKAGGYLAYFQAYSNTHAPLEELRRIYDTALSHPLIDGIVVGTRPDCVDEAKLDYFAQLSKQYYVAIEYGVESCYDKTLIDINRMHDFACSQRAIAMTKQRGIKVGAHFILGLPGESKEMAIEQTELINSLGLDTVKFHQLQIFKDTAMEHDFAVNPSRYKLFELDEYIELFATILSRLSPSLIVERFASEAPPRYNVTQSWGKVRNERLWQLLEKYLIENNIHQGSAL